MDGRWAPHGHAIDAAVLLALVLYPPGRKVHDTSPIAHLMCRRHNRFLMENNFWLRRCKVDVRRRYVAVCMPARL